MAAHTLHGGIKVGDIFGRWLIVGAAPDRVAGKCHKRFVYFHCRCQCGVEREVIEGSLRSGRSRSCGCLARERSSQVNTVHGAAAGYAMSPEYAVWRAIIARCENQNNKRYADYGGRGIKIDAKWRKDFKAFLSDVGPRPGPKYSIDRRDNDADYAPGNCRWATSRQQMVNRRNTRMVKTPAGIRPLADLAKECGIPANTLRARLELGWSLGAATSTPVRSKAPNGSARYQRVR